MKRQVGILCPTCGRGRMERVSREITTRAGRRTITVSDVEVDISIMETGTLDGYGVEELACYSSP